MLCYGFIIAPGVSKCPIQSPVSDSHFSSGMSLLLCFLLLNWENRWRGSFTPVQGYPLPSELRCWKLICLTPLFSSLPVLPWHTTLSSCMDSWAFRTLAKCFSRFLCGHHFYLLNHLIAPSIFQRHWLVSDNFGSLDKMTMFGHMSDGGKLVWRTLTDTTHLIANWPASPSTSHCGIQSHAVIVQHSRTRKTVGR